MDGFNGSEGVLACRVDENTAGDLSAGAFGTFLCAVGASLALASDARWRFCLRNATFVPRRLAF
jgi:hypothetical protein